MLSSLLVNARQASATAEPPVEQAATAAPEVGGPPQPPPARIQRGLERAGHTVVAAPNGEQAFLEFQRARANGRPFELALLNITVRLLGADGSTAMLVPGSS